MVYEIKTMLKCLSFLWTKKRRAEMSYYYFSVSCVTSVRTAQTQIIQMSLQTVSALIAMCALWVPFCLVFFLFAPCAVAACTFPVFGTRAPVFRETPSYFGRQRVLLSEEVK